ncbi:tyrosyl-tRNA synthetase [Coniothyrium glycines]
MSFLRHLSRQRQSVCTQCIRRQTQCTRRQHTIAPDELAGPQRSNGRKDTATEAGEWYEQAGRIQAGMQQSMLSILEERGLVKDIAGGRQNLDWLLTKKRIGVYVGVDPTAPSLHVGHLLPLMVLYWMHLHGYDTVSLLGGGTVKIGDPSGRTTARSRLADNVQMLNIISIRRTLHKLWSTVRALGVKHNFPQQSSDRATVLNNHSWLQDLKATDLMRLLGSGMRLGSMLSRDSVKLRLESGEGMSFSEFSYPLFQGYDWWCLYHSRGVQLQVGGSDQYGNIVAGMDAVSHMRKTRHMKGSATSEDDSQGAAYGLTTPLLTTASGEKFGKSAGNAVWLDRDMMSSYDLYQYFLRTADDDVERYLKLFTFLPLNEITLLMTAQRQDESKRLAQHMLAKEVVELVHGASFAKNAETAHKAAFAAGTNTFSLGAIRDAIASAATQVTKKSNPHQKGDLEYDLLEHKKAFAASAQPQPNKDSLTADQQTLKTSEDVTVVPITMLEPGSFPRLLHAAGLAASKSEAHRLIANKGAYVVVPNSGTLEAPTVLHWAPIESGPAVDPNHFLVDWEALVLRSGKAKIKIVRVVEEKAFVEQGLNCTGWEDFKARRSQGE